MTARLEIVVPLEGVDDGCAALEALSAAWDDAALSRAVLVTPPPSRRLGDLLGRLQGDVEVVPVAAGTRFGDALAVGLKRTTTPSVAVLADDVEVEGGWWRPLLERLAEGAAVAVARLPSRGSALPCWQDIGMRTCRAAPDHAAGVLLVGGRAAVESLARGARPFAPACGSLAGVLAALKPGGGGLAVAAGVPARWARRPFWAPSKASPPALPRNVELRIASPDAVVTGPHTYFDGEVTLKTWMPGERIVFGAWTSVADGVVILTGGGHRTSAVSLSPLDHQVPGGDHARYRSYQTTRDTVVGNDVWIATRATIVGGARIGDGAVVGAGAVVFGDVPPYAIVAGNPARVIRYRFHPDTIARLLRIAWWRWPDGLVAERVDWFYRPVREFCDAFDPGPADGPLAEPAGKEPIRNADSHLGL